MESIAHKWAAAAFSGFASPDDWRQWADLRLSESDAPETWMSELSMATSAEGLGLALRNRLRAEELDCGHRIYIGNSKLGYLYWKFVIGRSTFSEFLNAAGAEADGGTGDLECESVYALLNEYEDRLQNSHSCDDLVARVAELFQPFFDVAQSEWRDLGLMEPERKQSPKM